MVRLHLNGEMRQRKVNETDGPRFKSDPQHVCFMLIDQRPKGRHVQLVQDPVGWWDDFMAAIHAALEPFAPKPNRGVLGRCPHGNA